MLSRRQILGGALALVTGCERAVPAVATPVSAQFDIAGPSLRILTWNIWMMPPWTNESPRNVERAAAIAAKVLAGNFDILCFQKAFDPAARAALERALGDQFPHRYGPANEDLVLLNSGLWVLSKTPFIQEASTVFTSCRGIECFSQKGAALFSGSLAGHRFRLIVTHLQGEVGSFPTGDHQTVRQHQLRQIHDELIAPNLEPDIPFIFCGDFRTARGALGYEEMLATLGADNDATERITFDDPASGFKGELDYVLIRPNGARVMVERELYESDLSYRHAVGATIRF